MGAGRWSRINLMPGPSAPLETGEIQLYLGLSGFGKTFLALHHLKAHSRVLIHDPNCDAQLAETAIVTSDPAELVGLASRRGPVRICWRGVESMEKMEAFEWANRAAWAGEGFAVFWDEIDRFIDRGGRLPEWADKLVNAGRHRGCIVLAAARRVTRIPTDIRDGATRICTSRVGPGSVPWFKDIFGAEASRVRTLRKRHFLDYDGDTVSEKKSPFP